ncbi:MAG: Crp/Fnr family transcriptional regulator, partial [Bacteroidota bacterium]
GEVQKEMGFVTEGLLRRYYINAKGNDITTSFAKELEYVTDYSAFIQQKPSKYFLQCPEPSVIVSIPYEIIQESYKTFDQGQLYGRRMVEQTLIAYHDRVESFLFLSAEERYLKFMAEQPELMNRVSLTHLSSYLGIERQSLSRIRKKISSQ